MLRPSITIKAVLVVTSLLLAAAAQAQTTAQLFDAGTLQEIRLWMNSRDLDQLREKFESDEYYPADMEWGTVRVGSVGIRSRGRGSRNPQKLALRIDFNRYVTDQKFLGVSSLVLDNGWEAPSMIRERRASLTAASSSTAITKASIRSSSRSTNRFSPGRSARTRAICSTTSTRTPSTANSLATISPPTRRSSRPRRTNRRTKDRKSVV